MSPLDDELRAALHGRATALAPSPDPLAGIERRAKRLQRSRIGAAVAGSALAVAAIAAVVPALQSSVTAPRPPQVAATENASPAPTSSALDPQRPWAPRGTAVDEGTRATIQGEYVTRVKGAEVLVTPLFAQVYEPSGQLEVVFLADVDGTFRWGVAVSTEAGPEFRWDEPLPNGTEALAAALPGDEVPRLLVVTAPDVGRAQYGNDDASEWVPMASLAPGISTHPLEGDRASDAIRVLDRAGAEIFRGPAPDLAQPAQPANVLSDWPTRGGAVDVALEAQLVERFRQGLGAPTAEVGYRALFRGDTDGGVRYTIGQAWLIGQEAHTVALTEGGTSGEQFLLGPKTDPDARVVAAILCCQPGSTVDTLVVIPVPGTGQVLYAPGRDGEPEPVGAGQDFLNGVVLVDRDPRADGDRLLLLDGDGDLDTPLFDGEVFDLLCGLKECG